MYQNKPINKPALTLSTTNFTFQPDTFRFGADQQFTVITAYLELNSNLTACAKERRSPRQTGEPTAFIVAYDVPSLSLHLICIDVCDTQCQIPLLNEEVQALTLAMAAATQKKYGCSPEEQLNRVRAKTGLSVLHIPHAPRRLYFR